MEAKSKYKALIFNPGNENPIGQVSGNSIEALKQNARNYAHNYNDKGGRIMLQEQTSGRIWYVNS